MIYIIGGQTASGKTELALEFAQKIGAHIINGDAFQVYRRLDIGTAKASKEEQSLVPHHLIDIVDINEAFSIFEYQELARKIIDRLVAKNIPVVIVGGSGLYIRSVLFDYRFSPNSEADMARFEKMDNYRLHQYLASIDEISAEKIHFNNRRRVLRAIEIYLQTGLSKSALELEQSKQPYYPYTMVMVDWDKEQLDARILERIRLMFAQGLRSELAELLETFPSSSPGFRAIGYKEMIENANYSDEQLIDLINKNTIHYAKRQKTFFKNQFNISSFTKREEALEFLLDTFKGAL
ncbi:MAG TPA: tRNA (adenosine(37)-N6)-dimethylallyltransferase MiaA [Bacilli bacterium]|nr:tRNA (adenosine(37)-N6)-dimethylallyltransferase MiaA [Bacilli bacterium]